MLELRPGCECCDLDLPPDSPDARICSFECTFCATCAESKLGGFCPNCGGELVARPRRSADKIATDPLSSARVSKSPSCGQDQRMLSELRELAERWFQAWLDKDAATVERLMAEDYVYIGPNGLTMDRHAILAVIHSPSYRLDHGTRSEVVVRALGAEAAVERHRYLGAGSFEGTAFTDDHRSVMVWEKCGGQWRLVMEQCSYSGK